MFGGELLMALAQGQRLGGFHETAGAVGVFLEIHASTPSAHYGAELIAGPRRRPARGIMWVSLLQFEEPVRPDIGHRTNARAGLENAQKSMTNQARIDAIYRYPVKGLSPQRLRAGRAVGRRDPAGRPALRHRERPQRLRPRGARLFPQAALSDADAQRAAGGLRTDYDEASHTLTIQWEGREAARGDLAQQGRPAGDRGVLPPLHAEGIARAAQGAVRRGPQFLGRGEESRLHHQPRLGGGGGERGRRAGQSVALSRQYLCRRLAGLA